MKKIAFGMLNQLNKLLLPSLFKKDPNRLKGYEKAILGFRYWVLINYLKAKEINA
ncbi:hypothetical protein [Pedobacter montanisoli]|uniref:SsrA-binding protein n=1 Tax=Pedobacter montanisoli TaxID=2923277 RepID=A0ABS9ZYL4_9SPHI|nr:hypothetical protein [Pedobacter montanisoli]MCJ0743384.1 hypothetical protein [Pedobacter montanisoli]